MPDVSVQDSFEGRYTIPIVETINDSAEEIRRKQERVRELCAQRNAVLLAHHYQRAEVQEVADHVADSLKLSQAAAKTTADVIVFCGVHFMAETASILCPDKHRPAARPARRVFAFRFNYVEELLKWKANYPDAVVVSYINTSAAVKAESDYCCTSANAAKVVTRFLQTAKCSSCRISFWQTVVARQTGRSNIIAYPGYCHVHKTIQPEQVVELLDEHPDIELLLHPECGCVSSCMAKAVDGTLPQDRTFFLSTEGMLRHIGQSPRANSPWARNWVSCTGCKRTFPTKTFYPVNPNAVCGFMKTITLDNVIRSLETLSPEVRSPKKSRATRRAIDRMLELA